jgi:hypothetical protein
MGHPKSVWVVVIDGKIQRECFEKRSDASAHAASLGRAEAYLTEWPCTVIEKEAA